MNAVRSALFTRPSNHIGGMKGEVFGIFHGFSSLNPFYVPERICQFRSNFVKNYFCV
jgi:hypothetical protein